MSMDQEILGYINPPQANQSNNEIILDSKPVSKPNSTQTIPLQTSSNPVSDPFNGLDEQLAEIRSSGEEIQNFEWISGKWYDYMKQTQSFGDSKSDKWQNVQQPSKVLYPESNYEPLRPRAGYTGDYTRRTGEIARVDENGNVVIDVLEEIHYSDGTVDQSRSVLEPTEPINGSPYGDGGERFLGSWYKEERIGGQEELPSEPEIPSPSQDEPPQDPEIPAANQDPEPESPPPPEPEPEPEPEPLINQSDEPLQEPEEQTSDPDEDVPEPDPSVDGIEGKANQTNRNDGDGLGPPLRGYCFPECSNTIITDKLENLIPKITIEKLGTNTFPKLFEKFINGLKKLNKNPFSIGFGKVKGLEANTLYAIDEKLLGNSVSQNSGGPNLPGSIKLLFNSIEFDEKKTYIVLPITSTPIAINSSLDHGWKSNQSVFDFIKKQLGGGFTDLLGTMFGDIGKAIANITGEVAKVTENLVHIFGRDLQLGPYWSLGEGALDNRQALTFNTILVNDSKMHYEENAKVMRELFINSQPLASGEYKIKPPSLFNVEIDTKVAGCKKYFLCTGQFSCEAKGRYYSTVNHKKVPEAYSLSLTFTSLIPDMFKIQQELGGYKR